MNFLRIGTVSYSLNLRYLAQCMAPHGYSITLITNMDINKPWLLGIFLVHCNCLCFHVFANSIGFACTFCFFLHRMADSSPRSRARIGIIHFCLSSFWSQRIQRRCLSLVKLNSNHIYMPNTLLHSFDWQRLLPILISVTNWIVSSWGFCLFVCFG